MAGPKGARQIAERWSTSPTSEQGPALDILEPLEDPNFGDEEPIALDPSAILEEPDPGTIDLRSVDEPETLKRPRAIILPGGAWPSNVPGTADAAFALTGTMVPPFLADLTNAMRHELTPSEHRALAGKDPDLHLAVTLRWRLAIAFELAPKQKNPDVDRPAFDRLLADLDKTMHVLGTIRRDGSERAEIAHLARSALLRSAAFLSQLAPRKAETGPAVPGARPPLPRKTSTERTSGHPAQAPANTPSHVQHLTTQTQDLLRRTRRRAAVFLVLFLVSALGTGGFHYWRWSTKPPPPARLPLAKIPAGTLLRANQPDGVLVLHAIENGKPIAPEKLRAFKAAAEAEGKVVVEMGRNALVAIPKEVSRGLAAPKTK